MSNAHLVLFKYLPTTSSASLVGWGFVRKRDFEGRNGVKEGSFLLRRGHIWAVGLHGLSLGLSVGFQGGNSRGTLPCVQARAPLALRIIDLTHQGD